MPAQNNKYLTLLLADEIYAIPVQQVKEILGVMEITHVPRMPKSIKGVINLRGKIIPVIDLRLNFELEEKEYDSKTSIIVVEIAMENGIKTSGIIVDSVQEVITIKPENIDPPPKYGAGIDSSFLMGIGKIKETVVMVLDVDKTLTREEKDGIDNIIT